MGLRRCPGIISRSPDLLAAYPGLQAWDPVRRSHAPHMETHRESVPRLAGSWGRATPRCFALSSLDRNLRHPILTPQKVEWQVQSQMGDQSPEHLAWIWTFLLPAYSPQPTQSCSWGWSDPGISCSWGTTGSSRLGCREALSVCAQSHRQPRGGGKQSGGKTIFLRVIPAPCGQ